MNFKKNEFWIKYILFKYIIFFIIFIFWIKIFYSELDELDRNYNEFDNKLRNFQIQIFEEYKTLNDRKIELKQNIYNLEKESQNLNYVFNRINDKKKENLKFQSEHSKEISKIELIVKKNKLMYLWIF